MNQSCFRMSGRYLVRSSRLILCAVALCVLPDCGHGADTVPARCVELTVSLRVHGLENGQVRVWIPVPQSSPFQSTTRVVPHASLPLKLTMEPRYGNEMLFGEGTVTDSGDLDFEILWKVTRRETRTQDSVRRKALPIAATRNAATCVRGAS